MRITGRKETTKHPVIIGLLFLLAACLTACSAPTAPSPTATSSPASEEAEQTTLSFEPEHVLLIPQELRAQADLIFAGTVQAISPTHWNQDSGEYWTEATVDGETTFSAWPVYEITLSVDRPVVDNIGVDQEVVLTLLGKSPADPDAQKTNDHISLDADTVDLQMGQEILVFASQTELAWRDPSRPIELLTQPDGTTYFDIGRRSVITLLGLPSNAYLVKGNDGLYHPAPGATNQEEPVSLDSLLPELSAEPTPTVPAENEFVDLRKVIGEQNVVLYSAQEQGTSSLLSWPELPALARPEFAAAYGEQIGYMYFDDLAPQLSPSGQYLMVPKVDWQAGVSAAPEDSTTWIVDLQSGTIQDIAQRPLLAVWAPNQDRLAFVKDDTLYVQEATEQGGTPLFTQPGLEYQFYDWSPDGSRLVAVNSIVGRSVAGAYPPITSTLWIVPAEGGEAAPLGTFTIAPMEHSHHALQWSPDGTAVSVAMSLPNIIFYLNGKQTTLAEGSRILSWVPGQSALLVQQGTGLAIVDANSLEVVYELATAGPPPHAWAFSADGRTLAYSGEGTVEFFDLERQETLASIPVPAETVTALHWLPAGDILVVDDGTMNTPIWGVHSDGAVQVLVESGVLLNVIPALE